MTATLISLISVFSGIIGANMSPLFKKKYTLGFTGNTIAGVFGSVFLIKSVGRIGFSPTFIIHNATVNYLLLTINILISLIGGVLAVVFIQKLKNKLNPAINY